MTVYEKLNEHGVVVERVQPIEGDHTDTLLGCLVLDDDPHWRIAGAVAAAPVADETPVDIVEDQAPVEPKPEPTPKPAGKRATPKE